MIKNIPLNSFLSEYTERNVDNKYKPVAVGRYGIRSRNSIYSKELAKDYSKNKLIFKNTLTIGMGSVQIDIGILSVDETYSVSPAYHTYRINDINPNYLRYCLECRNQDMFVRYVKKGSRQGKTIDLSRWLTYEIPVCSVDDQGKIVDRIDRVQGIIDASEKQLIKLDELVKSRFVEMFGEPSINSVGWAMKPFVETCTLLTGNTPPRAVKGYYGSYIEWIKSDNITTSSLYLTKAAECLSEEGAKVGRVVHPGAILMTCIAGSLNTVGNVAIVDRDVAFNQQINALIPQQYETMFLYVLLQLLKPRLHEAASSALKCILNKGNLELFEAIVPSVELQKQFAAFVTEVDKSKLAVKQSLEKLETLKKSLMQQYFG